MARDRKKTKVDLGALAVERLRTLSRDFFDIDVVQVARDRDHEFWAVGIDTIKKKNRDLLGNIGSHSLAMLNAPGKFIDADTGYLASAQKRIDIGERKADIFLINIANLRRDISAILVHEICHLVEQVGGPALTFTNEDATNADVILRAFNHTVRTVHTVEWARIMSWAARKAKAEHIAPSVRSYLEQAIPHYDRPNWEGSAIVEPA